jgi:cellobiose phosphorylase
MPEERTVPHPLIPGSSEPIRGDLVTGERLADEARLLAGAQTATETLEGRTTPLPALVSAADTSLHRAYSRLASDARADVSVSVAAEWLLDNFYLIEEQIDAIQVDLPRDYGLELPRLTAGPLAGFPRVLELTALVVGAADGRLSSEDLDTAVMAFQDVAPLTIGEVWAVPIMFRVCLVENLARLSSRVLAAHQAGTAADAWANRILVAVQGSPGTLSEVVDELASGHDAEHPAFLIRLLQRLRDQDPAVEPAVAWAQAQVAEHRLPLEDLVLAEQQAQAADQVSIANTITSIRFLSALDWRRFFERCSIVEAILREDPAGVYARMDFISRDRYRHSVEQLAERSEHSQVTVAEAAVSLALEALEREPGARAAGHVGYHLIDGGRRALERSLGYRPTAHERLHRGPLAAKGLVFGGMLALFTAAAAFSVGAYVAGRGVPVVWAVLLALVAVIPLSDLAMGLTNRISTWIWRARVLPKLDDRLPVTDANRSMVVVPALLTSPASVRHVLENLEIAYLANRDANVRFGLLGDLRGAAQETTEADGPIIEAAREGIAALNATYASSADSGTGATAENGPFHLFIRSRRFNKADGVWMGWERKRGALEEFCSLLRGAGDTSYTVRAGDDSVLPGITFVITLDADTILPRDTARRMIATIAHPLNRAELDVASRRVVRGYGLIQPRVAMSLEGAERSPFAWLYSGVTGIDPYVGAVSDTYQDVFGEGSFTGKGIFEVEVMNAVLENRFPENTLLSHDLLEGSYIRTALASDVEVVDDQPSSYLSHVARNHRWVRGDWQTLPWLGRRVPTASGAERNPLNGLSRWKIIDNLRRSLVAPALMVLAAVGWAVLPGPDWLWLALLLSIVLFPVYFGLVNTFILRGRGDGARRDIATFVRDFWRDTARAFLELAVLPHQAYMMLDAIVRSLWRMHVSHKDLLEWETAADVERRAGADLPGFVVRMRMGLALAVVALVPAAIADPASIATAMPLVALWLLGPYAAWRVSQPSVADAPVLTADDVSSMRLTARRTWRFFETFVTPEDHWLAPDNYQEDPKGEVAHRTSPTNMGLQLISGLTAYDLGYVTIAELVDRSSRTLTTLAGLERWRGHFFNWYDTLTLEALRPGYISTVDSGNLAGHLVVLRVGLEQAALEPLVGAQTLAGIKDTTLLALGEIGGIASVLPPGDGTAELRNALDELVRRVDLEHAPATLAEWRSLLARLAPLTVDAVRYGEKLRVPGEAAAALDRLNSALADVASQVAAPRALIEQCAPAGIDTTRAVSPGPDAPTAGVPSLRELTGIEGNTGAEVLLAELNLAVNIARETADAMDFASLYVPDRGVFSIGFNTAEGKLDDSYYDMLASECRLTSFFAIATGDVPQEHWFRLGRSITETEGGRALVSWSASMFEYLMPLLVMRSWPGTLLDQTYRNVVRRQIHYGHQRSVPWGVSESAFNAKDVELTYQYQAFGVPGLGLKRGLADDVVVAPYATVLALPVAPHEALGNLQRLAREGALGHFGYYEAIDYTPGRVPAGRERAIVKAYMAHHQGMSMVALGNMLTNNRMQERFHADPVMASAELLLQERVPRMLHIAHPHVEEVESVRSLREVPPPVARSYPLASTPTPATHFLSNGSYSVMVTNAGGGYSRWRDHTVTRYREDITRDCWGQFLYLRDVESGHVWSSAFQPSRSEPDDYHVIFSVDKAEFRRVDREIETHTEITVSPEDDVEVRRITVTNHRRTPVTIEVTSYFEATLAERGADHAHKAYSNLFLQTEALASAQALLFTRRPRAADEPRVWGVHVLSCDAPDEGTWTYETDRARFLGRLHTPVDAEAIWGPGTLSKTTGAVLDPICSIRQTVTLGAGQSARLAFSTGATDGRDRAVVLAEKYRDPRGVQRAFDLAWSTSQIELRDLGITPEEAVTFQRLASRLLLTDPRSRLKVLTETETRLQLSGLWSIGISGDNPILLIEIERLEQAPLVRQALLAHQYWRSNGFDVDLVVLNTKPSAYASELDSRLRLLMRTGQALQLMDRPSGVFLRTADHMPPEVKNLLRSVARAVLTGDGGPIELHLGLRAERPELPDPLVPTMGPVDDVVPAFERPVLEHDNGYGGFDTERDEYVIVLEGDETTPAPWVNVLANPRFGSLISEAGVGCTWAENSHENRITTWNNDPVSDGTGEVFYIRDEATGEFWSPTPLPCRDEAPYVIRHGRGYSRFEHSSHGIAHELDWIVAADEPVRLARLRLTNETDRERQLTVTHLVEWVLGDSRSRAQQRVVTWWDSAEQLLMAVNWFNLDFPGRPAFLAVDGDVHSYTASRTEFIGRNGEPQRPAAMGRRALGGETGRFHDTCGALMRAVTLEPGGSAEVVFILGQAESVEAAHALARRFRAPGAAERELALVRERWAATLGAVQVATPDAALDRMVNGGVLYQALACRFWGRTATYQSSGALGFRDQLQDCLALLYTRPDLVREHIVDASRRQFPEGDVLHWWQPESGRGVRTRFTDDRLWLPFVVAEYIAATGDDSVLSVEVPYLEGAPVPADREDLYLQPQPALRVATVYEHCTAAIRVSAAVGAHGLPLMGGGDWNDGMNRVGIGGKGESVWLAWFLDVVLRGFAPLAEARGDVTFAEECRAFASELVAATEREAWDGAWYRRAFFDDGTPLGTRDADECQIDAIAQAWATIAGTGDAARARRALESVEEKLVRWEDGLVALLTPPFDRMEHDPGYIKGYVPGVRENGGQYTHAAIWVALAYAKLGDGDEAVTLMDLINPVNHALDRASAETYKVEPYVLAADVYGVAPHVGRGGWTWYTGSASWYYRVAVRDILGLKLEAADGARFLRIDPCVPKSWTSWTIEYRHEGSTYRIRVENPRGANRGVERVTVDGVVCEDGLVQLAADGKEHGVFVTMLGG